MQRAVHVLLLVLCTLPLSACAQESTFRGEEVDFVKQTVTVDEGQKEAKQLAFSLDAIATEAGPFAVELVDLNGDDHLDVVAALDEESSLVQVFLGDGRGAFREAEDSPFRLAAGGKMIAQDDFNGDGVDDAAITGWSASEVLLLLGRTQSIRTARLPDAEHSWGPVAVDLNGDTTDDLVIPDAANAQAVIYMSREE